MASSFTMDLVLVSTVEHINIKKLGPDKDGCVTVFLENTGDPNLPLEKDLRPLFLVPRSMELIKNRRQNTYTVPENCSHIEVEITHNRAIGGKRRSYFLGLRVTATIPTGTEIWHFDAGPKKTE